MNAYLYCAVDAEGRSTLATGILPRMITRNIALALAAWRLLAAGDIAGAVVLAGAGLLLAAFE